MATAVVDLDFDEFPGDVSGLERYRRALVVIRLDGQVVGQVVLPVVGGRLECGELRRAVLRAGGWPFWQRWLQRHLGLDDQEALDPVRPRATVAVCTRDRPEDLETCLVALMKLPDDGQEILVVDSCSATSAPRRVAESFEGVRYVRASRPGLSVARNCALREARHEIVAFIDDDAVPDRGWLRGLLANFDHPLVLGVCGLTLPIELETEAQEAFERYVFPPRGFRRIVFDSSKLHPLRAGVIGAGANVALCRTVLDAVGPFDESLGAGAPAHAGEETEMFGRILASGYRLVYDPAALVYHRHGRTRKELRRAVYGYGVGTQALFARSLFVEGELDALGFAWRWMEWWFSRLVDSLLRRRGYVPLDLLFAELLGHAAGPWAYLYARWQLGRRSATS